MKTGVDANVLFDLIIPGAEHKQQSRAALDSALVGGQVAISEAAYAELAGRFDSIQGLDRFLKDAEVQLDPAGKEVLYEAGQAWVRYARNRPMGLACGRCGHVHEPTCPICGGALRSRQHILAGFLIGAHALLDTDRLLTRDRGFYSTYFPNLPLMLVP